MRIITLTCIASLAIAGCGKQPPASEPAVAPPAIATSRQIMLAVVIPAADIVWSAASTAPADDAAWEKIQANAAMLAEAGNMLLSSSRAVDQGEWSTHAKVMVATATAAAQAAAEKNLDKLNEAANNMYDSCEQCHQKYMVARQGEPTP